jgi:phosphatidylserine/phosphatidylglycerophosphate/cardiolipin synthase-like enzyme
MRVSKTKDGFKVHAVAGTYVVMLGFDLPQKSCTNLKGFSIHRIDHTEDEAKYLEGMKAFAETDPGFPAGAMYSTKDHPIQSFQWSDYSAKPGHEYTYTIAALKGTPERLTVFAETAVDIATESPEGGNHDVYFNRGVAASQEYARRFGNRAPDKVPNNQAFVWLSRGLYEAMESYVNSCKRGDKLRIAAYEFHYQPFLKLLKQAKRKGVDVKVVFDKREAKPGNANSKAIKDTGIGAFCTPRKRGKSYISHNKFIVKLRGSKAVSVWTGGTNFSSGGIFGHSNVGHLVEEEVVARHYLDYWEMLAKDPETPEARDTAEKLSPLPKFPPPKGTSAVFSPRNDLNALNYYARLASSADHALFMTFAFGINKLFKGVYKTSKAPFRMALLEKATRPMKAGPAKKKEEREIQQLRNLPENTFAIGDFIRTTAIDGWLKERLTGLNSNVRYVHNKFMLVDPLSDDPIVVAGSANFSDASTTENDENMLVVRGNRRVADIYFGEFMRLYSHHAFRESLKWRDFKNPPKPLELGDWWRDYFGNTERSVRRRYFARSTT